MASAVAINYTLRPVNGATLTLPAVIVHCLDQALNPYLRMRLKLIILFRSSHCKFTQRKQKFLGVNQSFD